MCLCVSPGSIVATRRCIPGEARGLLRAPGYRFQDGQPPLRLSWKPGPAVFVEGFNADGDEDEIQLRAVVTLEIPGNRLDLLKNGKPRSQAEQGWLEGYTGGIRNDIIEALQHAFVLLRWRSAARGPQDYHSIRYEWREEGGEWKELPGGYLMFIMSARADIGRMKEVAPAVQEMLESGVHEPVAHQLLREAASLIQRERSSRAALVLAAAAVEVAVKDLIAHLAPKTEWLVENLPSPPVAKLMKEYVPALMGEGAQTPAFSADLIKSVEKMTRERNATVHTGARSLRLDRLSRRVQAAEDVVWRCDELRGNEWAGEWIEMYRITGLQATGPGGTLHKKSSLLDAPEIAQAETEEAGPAPR